MSVIPGQTAGFQMMHTRCSESTWRQLPHRLLSALMASGSHFQQLGSQLQHLDPSHPSGGLGGTCMTDMAPHKSVLGAPDQRLTPGMPRQMPGRQQQTSRRLWLQRTTTRPLLCSWTAKRPRGTWQPSETSITWRYDRTPIFCNLGPCWRCAQTLLVCPSTQACAC